MAESVPFEGVEKRLVIQFTPEAVFSGNLRKCSNHHDFMNHDAAQPLELQSKLKSPLAMTADEWTEVLDHAGCTIVSVKDLGDHRIYLLSESTLIVWQSGFLMKTCGRTTPFLALQRLLKPVDEQMRKHSATVPLATAGKRVDAEAVASASPAFPLVVNWMTYSRLEFIHPEYQVFPHQNFEQEIEFLRQSLAGSSITARSLPAGSNTMHFAFYASGAPCVRPYHMQEYLMLDIDPRCVRRLTGADNGAERAALGARLGPSPLRRLVNDSFLAGVAPADAAADTLTLEPPSSSPCASSKAAAPSAPAAAGSAEAGDNESTAASSEHAAHVSAESDSESQIPGPAAAAGAAAPAKVELDEFWFDPCGYSCNALMAPEGGPVQSFSCHISPEAVTSYGSFELGKAHAAEPAAFDMQNLLVCLQPGQLHCTAVEVAPEAEGESAAAPGPAAEQDLVLRHGGTVVRVSHRHVAWRDEFKSVVGSAAVAAPSALSCSAAAACVTHSAARAF